MRPGALDRWAPLMLGLAGTLLVHSVVLSSLGLRLGGPWDSATAEEKESGATPGEVRAELIDALALTPTIHRPGKEREPFDGSRQPAFPIKMLAVQVAMPDEPPDIGIEEDRAARGSPAVIEADGDLVQTCRREYADRSALARDIATVSLQGFVIREGQIRQGSIAISGGDSERARLALRCLQLFGTLGPARIDFSPFEPQLP